MTESSASLDEPEELPVAADAGLKAAKKMAYCMAHGNEGKAFQAVGGTGGLKNTACPVVAAGFASLTPQRTPPCAAVTCDVQGVAPLQLKDKQGL